MIRNEVKQAYTRGPHDEAKAESTGLGSDTGGRAKSRSDVGFLV